MNRSESIRGKFDKPSHRDFNSCFVLEDKDANGQGYSGFGFVGEIGLHSIVDDSFPFPRFLYACLIKHFRSIVYAAKTYIKYTTLKYFGLFSVAEAAPVVPETSWVWAPSEAAA